MFQNILAILSILKLVKRSKFYAPSAKIQVKSRYDYTFSISPDLEVKAQSH